jgi:hypothetical protein
MKTRGMRRGVHGARVGEMKCTYSISIEHPEGDKTLGRPKYRKKENIQIDFKE